MDDSEVWEKYPKYRDWFNKLRLSQLLNYNSGPCGVAPKSDGWYIVRPIYNLSGMSLGAEKKFIKANDTTQVPPGYFWCEWFDGIHYSATYSFEHNVNPKWDLLSCWIGEKDGFKFTKWKRSDFAPEVPRICNELSSFQCINVEFIDTKVIEVHLRRSPDPEYDEIIPIWENDDKILVDKYLSMGYNYVKSYDNADGFLKFARLGFMVKNKNG